MFNELLTGKASLEPPMAPFSEPTVTQTCATCAKPFQVKAAPAPTSCASCQLAIIETNLRNDALAFQQAEAAQQRVENRHKLFMIIGGLVVLALFAVFKVGMRTQLREDLAQGAGYKSYGDYKNRDTASPSDEYSQRMRSLANDMCGCKDLKCARDVQNTFTTYARSHGPSDDESADSAKADIARLGDCQNTIEVSAATP